MLVIYELFKKVLRERGEQAALEVYGLLSQANVVDVDPGLATAAARPPLPLADSIHLRNRTTPQRGPLDTGRAL